MLSQPLDFPIRRIFDGAFNRGDLAVIDEIVAPDSVTHTAGVGMLKSRLELKQLIASLRSAFPDLHCSVADEIREGDRAAARWIMRGTHQGFYLGSRPTNRKVEIQGFFLARIADGRIIENWMLFEELHLLQQIGLLPRL
jgi:predicted ester cyclase